MRVRKPTSAPGQATRKSRDISLARLLSGTLGSWLRLGSAPFGQAILLVPLALRVEKYPRANRFVGRRRESLHFSQQLWVLDRLVGRLTDVLVQVVQRPRPVFILSLIHI